MTEAELNKAAAPFGLIVAGITSANSGDPVPKGTGSIILLAPDERFWPVFTQSPEAQDGATDPIDRWSERAITALAQHVGGIPLFPFGGPPYSPFYDWALRSGRAWPSPISLLVHAQLGLFVSFRGAIALEEKIAVGPSKSRPCDTCAKPCRSTCPVGAFSNDQYDSQACHSFLSQKNAVCMGEGCLARKSCPVGKSLRSDAQNAFHMDAFYRSMCT